MLKNPIVYNAIEEVAEEIKGIRNRDKIANRIIIIFFIYFEVFIYLYNLLFLSQP
tara:strand:+ start:7552 stop:7716 length:165 start_codon:yes stop_codon:yes gene_type:complete